MTLETKHKILSVLIVTTGAFLGFQALSFIIGLYQLKDTVAISFYIYAFHIFWLTFIFDLHLKKRGIWGQSLERALKDRVEHLRNWQYFRHYQNYLVLPGIIYWGTVTLLLLNPFDTVIKQAITICSTFAMGVGYWYMKEHVSRKLEHEDHWIKALSLVKLYAAFIVFSASVGITFYYGYNSIFLISAVTSLTFLLIYQALFQHRLLNFSIFLWIVIISLAMGVLSLLVYYYWSFEYLTAGLVLLAIYNAMWGILHHALEHTLTKKLTVEYTAMMILIVSVLLASHNFSQRVI